MGERERFPRPSWGWYLESEEDPHAFVRDAGSIHITDDGPYKRVLRDAGDSRGPLGRTEN